MNDLTSFSTPLTEGEKQLAIVCQQLLTTTGDSNLEVASEFFVAAMETQFPMIGALMKVANEARKQKRDQERFNRLAVGIFSLHIQNEDTARALAQAVKVLLRRLTAMSRQMDQSVGELLDSYGLTQL